MIPTDGAIKEHERYIHSHLNLNDEWEVEVDVRPYLMTDFFYELHPESERIEIIIYSARYPQTWSAHVDDAIIKMKEGLDYLIEEEKISNPFVEE